MTDDQLKATMKAATKRAVAIGSEAMFVTAIPFHSKVMGGRSKRVIYKMLLSTNVSTGLVQRSLTFSPA